MGSGLCSNNCPAIGLCSDTVPYSCLIHLDSEFGMHRACQFVKWLSFGTKTCHDVLTTLHDSNQYIAFWHFFWVVFWLISFPEWLKAQIIFWLLFCSVQIAHGYTIAQSLNKDSTTFDFFMLSCGTVQFS